ncbi:hypothetical protein [Pseudomonas sp. S1Bt23]|uniref:hypothetical protein n=1 Tax=Pseudomonas sp. S1Bt23 TaxID=3095074 RepID=UPI002A5A0F06|nr:hypothetical protein [Pseudomonas sp. S1Bt23]WPO48686.1 hypothetical protein SHB59_06310 [Pseudomonas sp. S1Bt23]
MRSLPKPGITGTEALELCASSIRDDDLGDRMRLAVASVEAAEAVYAENGEGATLYAIARTRTVGGHVTGKEMERIYNGTFVKSSRTRNAYATLKKACVNDICPLCGQGTVRQLDHYLPITSYPVFGVTAINLVPACSDCNKYKLAHVPATAAEQTIHPYFDEVDDERWLFGEVVQGTPAAVRFSVIPPASWDAVKVERMRTHFRIYRLGALYATHAAVEIGNMRYGLRKMAVTAGFEQRVRQNLRGRAESCADVYENSWQRATFDALADSDWFCSGGFDET